MNKYFLLIGLLQLIPSVTPVDPITTLGPLVFIFFGNGSGRFVRNSGVRRTRDAT